MESIRANEGDAAVQRYYWELGRRIHHDRDFMNFELSDVLGSINVSADHHVAFENPDFDEEKLGVIKEEDISCPNFFKLGDKWVLTCISHRLGCRYFIGDFKDCLLYTSDAADE